MPQFLTRSLRLAFVAAALVATMAPVLPAAAEDNEPIIAMAPGAAMLGVDLPAPNTIVSNGQTVDIGGWTSGSRVDVYLDGPAGRGQGIGSAAVGASRPDVARATGNPDLSSSGFDVAWRPTELSEGPHTLYVYSLVNGSWTLQMIPIMGEGNVLPPEREVERGGDEPAIDVLIL